MAKLLKTAPKNELCVAAGFILTCLLALAFLYAEIHHLHWLREWSTP